MIEKDNKFKNRLQAGERYESYRALCEQLGKKYKSGKSKQLQIRDWSRYFSSHREGQAWIIDKVFDEPFPKVDKRSAGNTSIYIKDIEILILYKLYEQEATNGHAVIYFSLRRLMKELGMVNNLYQSDAASLENLSMIDKRITKYQLDTFYVRSDENISKILDRALRNLHNQKLINYKVEWMKIEKGKHYLIPERYYDDILKCEREVLDKYGYKTPYPFKIQGKISQYYEEVDAKVKEKLFPNIDSIYKRCKISCMKEPLLRGIQQNVEERENLIQETRVNLNKKIIKRLNDDAENTFERRKAFDYWSKDYFVSVQSELCDLLISLDMTEPKFLSQISDQSQYNQSLSGEDFIIC